MIQRIQSLYLVVAGALLALFLSLRYSWASGPLELQEWFLYPAFALSALGALVAFGATLLYKQRVVQHRVITAAQWIVIGLILVLIAGVAWTTRQAEVDAAALPLGFYLSILLPIVAYALLRLARRGVEKDVALIRSMDRIR